MVGVCRQREIPRKRPRHLGRGGEFGSLVEAAIPTSVSLCSDPKCRTANQTSPWLSNSIANGFGMLVWSRTSSFSCVGEWISHAWMIGTVDVSHQGGGGGTRLCKMLVMLMRTSGQLRD